MFLVILGKRVKRVMEELRKLLDKCDTIRLDEIIAAEEIAPNRENRGDDFLLSLHIFH